MMEFMVLIYKERINLPPRARKNGVANREFFLRLACDLLLCPSTLLVNAAFMHMKMVGGNYQHSHRTLGCLP